MEKRLWTLLILGFVFVHGAIMQVRGPILPLLESTFQVSTGVLGLVGPAATVGVVSAVLIGGLSAGRVDMHRLLLVALALTGISSIAVSLAPSIVFLLLFLTFQGLGTGLFRALDRPILGHMYSSSRGRMFSYYTAVWAMGAATAPLLITSSVQYMSWRGIYLLFVVPIALCGIVLLRLPEPPHIATEKAITREELRKLLGQPPVVVTISLVVLSGSIEGALFTWFPYFAGTFVSSATANTMLTYFFLAYIPGRLLSGTILEYVDNLRFVLLLALCSLPALYFTVIHTSHLTYGIIASGLFVSGMFPSLLAYGVNHAPEYSGPLNSVATGASLAGVTISPAIVGLLAAEFGIHAAMVFPLVFAGLLAIGVISIRLLD